MQLLPFRDVVIAGLLGERLRANAEALITSKDEEALLAGFRRRPGAHPWIGEHAGKWIHAARLVADARPEPVLERKIERVVAGLLACQEPDGYLGTYTREQRWRGWDVWVHKYVLIGLLAQYSTRADERLLDAARRIGDLLITTFGGRIEALLREPVSTHRGMAAGSVLEAIVGLYRASAEERFLDFARAIAAGFETPSGPRVVSTLLRTGAIARTANAKAYELLSCLNGLLLLHEVDPTPAYLEAATIAWRDIRAHHLYPSGGLSFAEFFGAEDLLPEAGQVSETCAVVTWMQLNEHLLRLGEQRACIDELQRSLYNALLAAQRPDGAAFCYFTPLAGTKPYSAEISCCTSSGPRGLALAQRWFAAVDGSAIEFFTLAPGRAEIEVQGRRAHLEARGDFTLGERCRLSLEGIADLDIELRIRKPEAHPGAVSVHPAGGEPPLRIREEESYVALHSGGRARLDLDLEVATALERLPGRGLQRGRVYLRKGPWILSWDEGLQDAGATAPTPLSEDLHWHCTAALKVPFLRCPSRARLCPLAHAGWSGSRYLTSLPERPCDLPPAHASASSPGRRQGRLDSGDPDVLWSAAGEEVWFALEWAQPRLVERLEFRQGLSSGNDGPFCADASGPRFEVRVDPGAPWRCAGRLPGYPQELTPQREHPPPLLPGTPFALEIPPLAITALRAIGRSSAATVYCAGLNAS